jgi:hypothetical protein
MKLFYVYEPRLLAKRTFRIVRPEQTNAPDPEVWGVSPAETRVSHVGKFPRGAREH